MTRLFKSAESIVHGTPFVPGNLSIISLLIFYLLINGLFCYIEKRVWSNFYSTKIAIFRAPALFLEKAVGCEQEKQPFGGGFLLRIAIFFGQNFDDFLKCSIFVLFEMSKFLPPHRTPRKFSSPSGREWSRPSCRTDSTCPRWSPSPLLENNLFRYF